MCAPSFARSALTFMPREPTTPLIRSQKEIRSPSTADASQSWGTPKITRPAKSFVRGSLRGDLELRARRYRAGAPADCAAQRDGRRYTHAAGSAGSEERISERHHRLADRGTLDRIAMCSRHTSARAALRRPSV